MNITPIRQLLIFLICSTTCYLSSNTLLADETQEQHVDIVMPAYNAEATISDTIQSVMAQTYPHWRLVIVDDGSTDRTSEIVRTFTQRDSRIVLHTLPKNTGAEGLVRNAAQPYLTARYLAFIDADDLWLPEKLTAQVSFMQQRGLSFSFTGYRAVSPQGELSGVHYAPANVTYESILTLNPICLSSVMLDLNVLADTDFAAEPAVADYILWLKILKAGHTGHGLKKDLVRYRVVPGAMSANKAKMAMARWRVYRKYEGFTLPTAGFYFLQYAFRTLYKHIYRKVSLLASPTSCEQSFPVSER